MSTTSRVPVEAEKITFSTIGNKKAEFLVWQHGQFWYWNALGNEGRANSRDEAAYYAKEWIKGRLNAKPGSMVEL